MSKTQHVKLLIEQFAVAANKPLDYHGFGKMSDLLSGDEANQVSQKYLDDIYRNVRRLSDKQVEETRIRVYRLDIIARYLGYENFQQFSSACEAKVSKELDDLCGNWWSYVRSNSGKYILKAPVRIYKDLSSREIMMELRGQYHLFRGVLSVRGTCVFTYLDSEKDKRIALVFKIGTGRIKVLQGTFCGISSNFDPIAGREVFERAENETYENMKWEKLAVNSSSIGSEIKTYFALHEQNCLKINQVSDFELSDLLHK